MNYPQTAKIKHVICDWDGVMYGNDVMAPYAKMWDICRVKITQATFPSLNFKEIEELSEKEFEEYLEILITRDLPQDPTDEQILDCKQSQQGLFHQNLFELVTPHLEEIFAPTKLLVNDFYDLNAVGVKFGVLSLADRKDWIEPQIDYIGLQKVFSYILDYCAIRFLEKEFSPEPVSQALEMAGTLPKETAFLEDNKRNLCMAKKHYPELTTIWISSEEEKPEYVDYMVKDLKGALKQIKKLAL